MKTIKKNFLSKKFYFLVFIILIWDLIRFTYIENDGFSIHSFTTTPYVLSYQEFGLIPRGLIGSIIRTFKPFVSVRFLGVFILLANIILIIIVTFVLGKVIHNSKKNQLEILFFALMFLLSPASISYLFSKGEFGRLDLFLIIISILCIILSSHNYLRWFIPFFCMMAVAIHEVFVFTYFILVLVSLLYMSYERNRSKASIILTILTLILTSLTFIYFQFFASVSKNFQSSTDMKIHLQNYTNLIPNDGMLGFEYFSDLKSHFFDVALSTLPTNICNLIIALALLSPVLYIVGKTWFFIIKNTSGNDRKVIIIMNLSPLISLPAFILTIDWGRWLASILIVQFAFIFFLDYKGKLPKLNGILNFTNSQLNNLISVILLFAYLPTLGKLRGSNNGALALPHTIINFFRTLFFIFVDGIETIYQNFFV